MYAAYEHFSRIAPKYTRLRTTDLAPVRYAVKKLGSLRHIRAADVGCGSGRYDRLLFQHLNERLELVCVDDNDGMLRVLRKDLYEHAPSLQVLRARAQALPFASESLHCMFTFNAIHHFKIRAFLHEAARSLMPGGLLFIYTRTRSQNSRHIWGKHFPQFYEKEQRLWEFVELNNFIAEVPNLHLDKIRIFQHRRVARLRWLLQQARQRHYSTFDLYGAEEFQAALAEFEQRLRRVYRNPNEVTWTDENLMLVARKMA
ncbi:class I SAM-dependent methyltransferase [candidate division KSB1 bacterium]|nr:class I SAM-dependent methyltransferase [candidate division KSB1 bacterium]